MQLRRAMRISINKWKLDIELTDTYDFTEILSNDKYKDKNKKYLTLGNVLNDFVAIFIWCYKAI